MLDTDAPPFKREKAVIDITVGEGDDQLSCQMEVEIISYRVELRDPGDPNDQGKVKYFRMPGNLNCLGQVKVTGDNPELGKWLIERLHYEMIEFSGRPDSGDD